MFNWKWGGGCFLFAALVSLLSGLWGGNPLGVVLLRLLLSGVAFSTLGYGIHFLTKKYLSEVQGQEGRAEAAPAAGVDIVIPEENPHLPLDRTAVQEVEVEAAFDAEAPAEVQATGLEAEVEEAEPLEAEEAPQEAPLPAAVSPLTGGGETGLDSLPDIEQLESSPIYRRARKGAEFTQAQLDALTQDQKPETLAKAVRTFLRKDQKG